MATAESPEVKNSAATDDEKDSALSAIVLAAVVLVVALLALEFGLQTMIWIETKSWAATNQ